MTDPANDPNVTVPLTGVSAQTWPLSIDVADTILSGQSIGTVVAGPRPAEPGTFRVESNPPSGGRSVSEITPDGLVAVEMSGRLDRGEEGQSRAVDMLIAGLRARGDEVTKLSNEHDENGQQSDRNSYGEDAILEINTHRVPIQIVTIPNDADTWRTVATGETPRLASLWPP